MIYNTLYYYDLPRYIRGGGVHVLFLMEHMVTFRKFRFYHQPTPSANAMTKKYQGTFKNLPEDPHPFFCKQKVPVYFSILLKTPPPLDYRI